MVLVILTGERHDHACVSRSLAGILVRHWCPLLIRNIPLMAGCIRIAVLIHIGFPTSIDTGVGGVTLLLTGRVSDFRLVVAHVVLLHGVGFDEQVAVLAAEVYLKVLRDGRGIPLCRGRVGVSLTIRPKDRGRKGHRRTVTRQGRIHLRAVHEASESLPTIIGILPIIAISNIRTADAVIPKGNCAVCIRAQIPIGCRGLHCRIIYPAAPLLRGILRGDDCIVLPIISTLRVIEELPIDSEVFGHVHADVIVQIIPLQVIR